jgi:hypothetical protein
MPRCFEMIIIGMTERRFHPRGPAVQSERRLGLANLLQQLVSGGPRRKA